MCVFVHLAYFMILPLLAPWSYSISEICIPVLALFMSLLRPLPKDALRKTVKLCGHSASRPLMVTWGWSFSRFWWPPLGFYNSHFERLGLEKFHGRHGK